MIDSNQLSSIAGKHVVGKDGERIGKIADVYESTDGGGGTFATVTTGLFGSGSSFFPLDAAEVRDAEVVVPYTKDFVKDAPRVADDDELSAPEEERLFQYYSLGVQQSTPTASTAGSDRPGTVGHDTVGHDTSGPASDGAMTRSEEKLQIGTERVESGRARLRKHVVTELETRTVPVSHEELRIEREPITEGNAGAALDGPALSEEEHEAVVDERAVPVERVRLGTETVTGQETVSEQVRKEQVELDRDRSATRS